MQVNKMITITFYFGIAFTWLTLFLILVLLFSVIPGCFFYVLLCILLWSALKKQFLKALYKINVLLLF